MLSIVLAAVSSASVAVAIPQFTVEQAPGILTTLLPKSYAASMAIEHCAQATPSERFGPQTRLAFEQCEGNVPCLAQVGKLAGANFVILGELHKLDEQFTTRLRVVDVTDASIRVVEFHHTGSLNGLVQATRTDAPELCRMLNPSWVSPEKAAAEQKLASLSFDESGLTNQPPSPPPPATAPVAPANAAPAPAVAPASPRPAPASVATDFAELPPLPPEPATPHAATHGRPAVATRTPAPAPVPAAPVHVEARATPPARPPPQLKPVTTVKAPPPRWALAGPRSPTARKAAFASLGTAAGALALAGGFGLSALSAVSASSNAQTESNFYAAQSTLQTRATVTNVGFGLAGAALVGAAVFWLKGDAIFGDPATTALETSK